MLDLPQICVKDKVCDKQSPILFNLAAHTQITMASFTTSTMASSANLGLQAAFCRQPLLGHSVLSASTQPLSCLHSQRELAP